VSEVHPAQSALSAPERQVIVLRIEVLSRTRGASGAKWLGSRENPCRASSNAGPLMCLSCACFRANAPVPGNHRGVAREHPCHLAYPARYLGVAGASRSKLHQWFRL